MEELIANPPQVDPKQAEKASKLRNMSIVILNLFTQIILEFVKMLSIGLAIQIVERKLAENLRSVNLHLNSMKR